MDMQMPVGCQLARLADVSALGDEALMLLLCNSEDRHSADLYFEEIIRRYRTRVTAWCCRLTKRREYALDLTQEVFLRAFRHRHSFRGDSRFSTWLYAITRNHCLNSLKKRDTEPAESGHAMPFNLCGSNGSEIHIAMERSESFQNMWRLVRSALNPVEIRVFVLHYGYGLPLAEITSRLRLTNLSGAKAHIVNGRRKLKFALSGHPPCGSAAA